MSTLIMHPDPVQSKREPFAAVPHTACESDLSDAAYRVLGAVLYFARRGSCDPTDRQLGQRCGKSVPAIQRGLRELEAKGWIERLAGARRVIRLRAPADPTCSGVIRSPLGSDQDPRSEVIRDLIGSDQGPDHRRSPLKNGEGEEKRNVTSLPLPEKATASPRRPQEPRPEVPTAPRPSAPVRPLLDELKTLPGADAPKVRSVAWRLAHYLKDVASVSFFIMVLGLVAKGMAPLQRLLDAFRVADRARGKAQKPGAIFTSTWSGWTPPPLPSEINRPTYSQAPRLPTTPPPGAPPMPRTESSTTPPPPGAPAAPPPDPEQRAELSPETIARWERIVKHPNHPEARIARVMLAASRAEAAPRPQEPRHGVAEPRADGSPVGAAGIAPGAATPPPRGPTPGVAPRA